MTWKDRLISPQAFDCSTFVCRVAIEALGFGPDSLLPDAGWLIDHLTHVDTPHIGDLVGYGRPAIGDEVAGGYDCLWHVMLYAGNGMVIGACDLKGRVVTRPIDYKPARGTRRWRYVGDPPAPFRALQLR
jgi:hypothetical protein